MNKCVVLAIGSHWDSGNSLAKQFKAIADNLIENGYQVIILVPGQMVDKVIEIGNPLVFTWPSKRPTKLKDAIFLHQILRKYKPDSIIGNFAAVNWTLIIGWLTKIKIRIAWYHTLSEQIKLDTKENVVSRSYHWIRKVLVYKFATSVIAVSEYAKIDVVKHFHVSQNKVIVFHNFLQDPTNFSPYDRKFAKLVCVGRLVYSKGQDILIKAMPYVKKRFPNVQLRFIGDGYLKNELQKMTKYYALENNIGFVGNIKPEDVLVELAESYICIHPARIDNCPLVLIEAISTGTPVIASRNGGIPEIIKNDFNGLLFTPGDSQTLSEYICTILSSSEIHKKYSDNAREFFLSEFEMDKSCKKIVAWLENQISESEHD